MYVLYSCMLSLSWRLYLPHVHDILNLFPVIGTSWSSGWITWEAMQVHVHVHVYVCVCTHQMQVYTTFQFRYKQPCTTGRPCTCRYLHNLEWEPDQLTQGESYPQQHWWWNWSAAYGYTSGPLARSPAHVPAGQRSSQGTEWWLSGDSSFPLQTPLEEEGRATVTGGVYVTEMWGKHCSDCNGGLLAACTVDPHLSEHLGTHPCSYKWKVHICEIVHFQWQFMIILFKAH